MKQILLRWQSIIAAIVGFALSVAWEVEIFSSITRYPFTWFFGALAAVLLVWGVVDALSDHRQESASAPSSGSSESDSSGSGGSDKAADHDAIMRRFDKIEQNMERMDDQVQELRREEL